MIRILFTGGGTGGHIYPLIAVIEEIRKQTNSQVRCSYVGSGAKLEEVIFPHVDNHYKISTGKYRRYFSLQNFFDIFRIIFGIFQSMFVLLREMPDVVFAKGGYVSVPVSLVAWLYRIPVVLHESDATPGTSNVFLAKFAQKVCMSYPSATGYFEPSKTVISGNPVEGRIIGGDRQAALDRFGLSASKPVILVYGGSQGSKIINDRLSDILSQVLEYAQVLHQTGVGKYKETIQRASQRSGVKEGRGGYHPIDYISGDDRALSYAAADLVIGRSGATSIAEMAACGKVALLIPLFTSANDHQKMNAYAVAKQGGAVVLEEGNLTPNIFFQQIYKLLFDEGLRTQMSQSIRKFYNPNAAKVVAQTVLGEIKK